MQADPFYTFQTEIDNNVADIRLQVNFFTDSLRNNASAEQIDAAKTKADASIGSLANNLRVAEQAVRKCEVEAKSFKLSPEEVARRRQWLNSQYAAHRSLNEAMNSPDVVAAYRAKQKIAVRASTSMASDSYQRLREDSERENSGFIGAQQAQQALLVKQQEDTLDDLHATVKRIGVTADNINRETTEQNEMLAQLQDNVEALSAKLKSAQKKVNDMLDSMNQKGKIGCIIVLILVLIGLIVGAIVIKK